MHDLKTLQHLFQDYLLTKNTTVQTAILETGKVSAVTRLKVYEEGYRLRLLESLADNFPCLKLYLGEVEFNRLGEGYIQQYPSSHRSIRWYGEELAHYLSPYPHLAEFALFEWKMTLAFDAAEAGLLQIEDMAKLAPEDWGNAHFIPHPSLQAFSTVWNVVPLWQALSHHENAPELKKNDQEVHWLIWRHDYINRYYSLREDEAWAIQALLKKQTFAEICVGLCQWFPANEVSLRAASLLKTWIQLGLLSEVSKSKPIQQTMQPVNFFE